MTSAEPEGARQELEKLQNYFVHYDNDKKKAFLVWARDHAESLYPEVGERSYTVPPLFVHQHHCRYDVTLGANILQQQQKSSPKGETAHLSVMRAMSILSSKLNKPLFIISGLEYDNMLKWVRSHPDIAPHLPDSVEKRGDIDIMAIHPEHGLIFIQVKAVGDNPQSRTPEKILARIMQGGKQLRKDENVFRWVVQDWVEATDCRITRVVALPNLSANELPSLSTLSENDDDVKHVLLLCRDDLPHDDPSIPAANIDVSPLLHWWTKNVGNVRNGTVLSRDFMKDIVSRYVGLLSAVVVYTGNINNVRQEVRSTSDAVDVCGTMFRRILLNNQQRDILSQKCSRCYLSGPPGSGKTVLLMLRARQFVQQGGHVVIVNMYRGAAGRAIGHYISEAVARYYVPHGVSGKKSKNKNKKKKAEEAAAEGRTPTPPTTDSQCNFSERVHAIDVDIDHAVFQEEQFLSCLRQHVPRDVSPANVMFVVDEIYVLDYWRVILNVIDSAFPGCFIWCAGLYSNTPPGFSQKDLTRVLRCPPLVQKVLLAVDWVEKRKAQYYLETDQDGLYTLGLTPLSIRHQAHPQVSVTECEICARELARLLVDELKFCASGPEGSSKVTCSDVVMLMNMPRELYEPDERGFLDTTRQDFDMYVSYLSTCPFISVLQSSGVPVKVMQDLPCYDLHETDKVSVPVAWVYTYQGLENKVVIYLPGDTPRRHDFRKQEIPAPGLSSIPRQSRTAWRPVRTVDLDPSTDCNNTTQSLPSGNSQSAKGIDLTTNACFLQTMERIEVPLEKLSLVDNVSRQHQTAVDCNTCPNKCADNQHCKTLQRTELISDALLSRPQRSGSINVPDFWWKKEDIEQYSNWDKSSLFVAGSRCLSQLIMIIP